MLISFVSSRIGVELPLLACFAYILPIASSVSTSALFLSPDHGVIHKLSLHSNLLLQWQLDYPDGLVRLEAAFIPSPRGTNENQEIKDWVAIGFSDYGEFDGADYCVFWIDWKGQFYITDAYTAKNETKLRVDSGGQDCNDLRVKNVNNGNVWSYTRKFDTCQNNGEDYSIEDGTTHIVWSLGKGPLYRLEGVDVNDPEFTEHGTVMTRFLKMELSQDIPQDTKPLEIRHEVVIPSDDTTYWCSSHKLPEDFERKHHVIQYEPVITEGNEHIVHHMEVFHCVSLSDTQEQSGLDIFPMWSGPCGDISAPLSQCKKVLANWAIGAGPFTYPKEAGLAIGGPQFNQYVLLEVHYNNERLEKGVRDNSGMRILVTEELRPYDAGVMELGLVYTDLNAIPPGQAEFPLHGYCLPECTALGLPSEGIVIFGSQLHTHGAGIRVETRHFRDGIELSEINRDNHYSTHFQEIRVLKETHRVLPGDELITTCWYNTMERDNITVGGFSFKSEMCVNYIIYYPRTDMLEVCKSSVDETSLKSFFLELNRWDGQETVAANDVTTNYQVVEWTRHRSMDLLSFYSKSPVQMQCQSGGGIFLSGEWKNMSIPDIKNTLNVPERVMCQAENNEDRSMKDESSILPLDINNNTEYLKNAMPHSNAVKRWMLLKNKHYFLPPSYNPLEGDRIQILKKEKEFDQLRKELNFNKLKRGLDEMRSRKIQKASTVDQYDVLKSYWMAENMIEPMLSSRQLRNGKKSINEYQFNNAASKRTQDYGHLSDMEDEDSQDWVDYDIWGIDK